MDKIDSLMEEFVAGLDYAPLASMFAGISSGKKLRSKLLLKIAGQSEQSLRLCTIIEMIHAASLLHDDVIDESDTRRGKPSINASFGSKNAIMLGDVLYSKGFLELCAFDHFIASCVSDAVCKLSIGELMDVNLGNNFNENLDEYFKMIYYKTAVLIEATAKCGAFLAGFDMAKFGTYGKNLGLAFQIIDDILDITQDSKMLGKPAFGDFKEGKTTLAYIYLYQKLNQNDKILLKSLFKKELNNQELSWINGKFSEFGIIEICINKARELGISALSAIKEYENESLNEIVTNMIDRKF